MTFEEIQEFIPSKFVLVNQTINVYIHEVNEDADNCVLGTWNGVKNEIILHRTIQYSDGEIIEVTKEQLLNTFYHELFHCFLDYMACNQDEMLVQAMANFMREFDSTKEFKE